MALQRLKADGLTDLRYTIENTGSGTSDWFLIPSGIDKLGVMAEPTTGARIEVTLENDLDKLENDTAAKISWPPGDVVDVTEALVRNAVAIRLVTTGAGKAHLNGTH
jgi:hypothetical protein